ncbi:MAG: C4-dicarboxylate ABC transporter, partial [Rhodobacteraceae bacterium]|nr:C4-dicarboxylate ABC transporter [Paracoccaceae bacterium]
MDDKDQLQAAAVENAAAGRGGLSQEELDELVASSDTGGRSLTGPVGTLVLLVALAWSLFQLWFSSPLPFLFGFGVFNDTEARSIHLAFALFLAFAAFPASRTPVQLVLGIAVPLILGALFMFSAKEDTATWWIPLIALGVAAAVWLGSPKDRIPAWEWALALLGAAAALYLLVFYRQISGRVGAPITQDFVVGVLGIVILLEATRRALGPALMIVATVFLVYTVLGQYMPELIAHKGNNLS